MTKQLTVGANGWVGYRSDIKILDCTVRDGGLINDHYFDDEVVRAVYDALTQAGVDYMELGYKSSKKIFAPDKFGRWKYCDEDDLRRVVGDNPTGLKLSVMAVAARPVYLEDILPEHLSVVGRLKVARINHQIPVSMDIPNHATDN